jgi:uncharacterized protein (TIRG00374 family)
MKKLHTVLLLLGVFFLAWLVWKIGFEEILRELNSLGWGVIPLILSEGLAEFIHTVGWRRCLSGPLQSLPLLRLFRIRMAGYAINNVTPTAAIGGEVTKAALLASNHRGPEAISGVLIEKSCFAFAHLLFVVFGSTMVLWHIKLPRALFVAMIISTILMATGIITFFLLQKNGRMGVIVRWLAARRIGGEPIRKAAENVTEVDEALKKFYRERPWDLALTIAWHIVGFTIGIFQAWLFFRLMDQHTSLTIAAGVWFIGMWFDLISFAVPMNIGALEGSRVLTLKAIGYTPLVGMTYGVVLRLAWLFWIAFGLINYALLAAQTKSQPSKNSTPPARADYRRTN